MADLFYMDLDTTENPQGSLSYAQIYKNLLDIRVWGVNNDDPAMAWNRRRWAQEAAQEITKSTRALVAAVAAGKGFSSFTDMIASLFGSPRKTAVKEGSLRWCGRQIVEKLLAGGKTVEETADICWLTSFGGVGVPVTSVS